MKCKFNHKNDPDGWPEATEAFAMVVPDESGGIIPLTLHVCDECAYEMDKVVSDWVALVCVECNSAQWSYRPQADRKKLPEDFKVMLSHKGCPVCLAKEWRELERKKYGR